MPGNDLIIIAVTYSSLDIKLIGLKPNLVLNLVAFSVFVQYIFIFKIISLLAYLKLKVESLFNSFSRLIYFLVYFFVELLVP